MPYLIERLLAWTGHCPKPLLRTMARHLSECYFMRECFVINTFSGRRKAREWMNSLLINPPLDAAV